MARVQNPQRVRILPALTAGLLALSVLTAAFVAFIGTCTALVQFVNWDDQWYSYVGMSAIMLSVLVWTGVAAVFIWRLTNGKA